MKFSNSRVLNCCFAGMAIAVLALASTALLATIFYGVDQLHPPGKGGGLSLITGFLFLPLLFIAGLPWSLAALHYEDSHLMQFGILVLGLVLNGSVIGLIVGFVKEKPTN